MTPDAFNPPPWPHDVARRDETLDRTRWGEGPWQSEPDLIGWRSHGLRCAIARNNMGALCGYVGVTADHPLFGLDYDSLQDAPSHGELTFGKRHQRLEHEGLVDVGSWVFGFDCGHGMDFTPGLARYRHIIPDSDVRAGLRENPFLTGQYRDVEYVGGVVELLAAWLAEAPAKLDALIARALQDTENGNQD